MLLPYPLFRAIPWTSLPNDTVHEVMRTPRLRGSPVKRGQVRLLPHSAKRSQADRSTDTESPNQEIPLNNSLDLDSAFTAWI
jgi:hypothetical protein